MYKPPGEWKLFHTTALRKFIKRIMKPKTYSQVYRSKTYLSIGYLLASLILFHRVALRGAKETSQGSDLQKLVNLNIPEAKFVRIEQGRLKEVIDFRREDYPELIENRPSYARE